MVFSSHTCSDTQISRLSKHVPLPINVHIFLYTLHKKTAEHKTELKVFSHSRLRVRYVLRACGVVTFMAGQPHESYHRRESLGSWTRVDCTETRRIKMSDSQLQELQRIVPHQFCTASD